MKKEPEQKLLEPEWEQRFRKMVEDAARSNARTAEIRKTFCGVAGLDFDERRA